jgi:phosphatidylcholine synthase
MQEKMRLARPRLVEVRAWAVHLYTSLGLVLGFLALIAAAEGRAREVALLMTAAMVVDGTDGWMARRWQVARWLPGFDGRKLDDITDYLNYAFIPVYCLYRFELVPGSWLPVLGIVLLAAAYGFCQVNAKTDDKFYTGFPNYWNLVVFYMYLLRLPPAVNVIFLLFFAAMVFVPIKYISTQTFFMRSLYTVLVAVWGLNILLIIFNFDNPNPLLIYISLIFPIYHMGLSVYLNFRPQSKLHR